MPFPHTKVLCAALSLCLLRPVLAADAPAPVVDAKNGESAAARDRRMAWWRDARFGMFIHWGLYAVPAGEYGGRKIPGIGEWIMDNAKIPIPEYEKFAPQFNPTAFDATAWARLAKAAGMKYMVITSKHHDGFSMFGTKVNRYNIVDATPFKRDPIRELSAACRKEGIKFGLYYSVMDWHHPDANATGAARYIPQMKAQLREIVTNYQPSILWFDGEWPGWWTTAHGDDLEKYVRTLKPDIVLNNRVGKRTREDGDYETPEQEIPASAEARDWETCMTMNDTWGFKSDDQNWKPTDDLVHKLADIAGKGGNFLLNVGPTKEGRIPQPSVQRLQQIGAWLRQNGAAIYGTKAGPFRSLPWGRITAAAASNATAGKLYAIVWDWPKDGRLTFPGLSTTVTRAYPLNARKTALNVAREGDNLVLQLPKVERTTTDALGWVVVLETKGPIAVSAPVVRQNINGSVDFKAAVADVRGALRYESGEGRDNIGYWTNQNDWLSWNLDVQKTGTFAAAITFACDNSSAGSEYEVQIGAPDGSLQKLPGMVAGTGGWDKFVTAPLGVVDLKIPGRYTVAVKALRKPNLAVMNLRALALQLQAQP